MVSLIIRQLSNRDKHRTLNPILVGTNTFTMKGGELEGTVFDIGTFRWSAKGKNLKIGTEIVRTRLLVPPPENKVVVAGYSTPDIRLPHRLDIPFMDAVAIMTDIVERVVDSFAKRHRV